MGQKWKYQPPTYKQIEEADRLSEELDMSPILCGLLVTRGITTVAEAKQFFRPRLSNLHNPFLMNDMDIAVKRLNQALGRKERILVYGDYDVDGTTAVALVYKFLQQFSSNIDYYIPDRKEDGYGISHRGVDYAHSTGVKLIIVLDCGIKALDEIAYAKSLGIDFIVCDHHVPDEELPQAVAILNPKRADNTYPYQHLSGCGVGFKFMQAFAMDNGIPAEQLYSLLDLVAVSIASDLVPIMGENRILAYHGLKQLNHGASTGLKAIIQVCGLRDKEININDIIFKIGPRINASGRIQQGKVAVDLLIENNLRTALAMSEQINEFNETRKDLDKSMTEEANVIVENLENFDEKRAIVIFNEDWHRGVIGIVASRLTETYYRPTIVLTAGEDGIISGSARSVGGFDIYTAIDSCSDLLTNFGGHKYAAGLSMHINDLPEFKQRFEAYVAAHIQPNQLQPTLDIEAELQLGDITKQFYNVLRHLEPFGPGNPRPLFVSRRLINHRDTRAVGKEREHLRLDVTDRMNAITGIAFGRADMAEYIQNGNAVDICYELNENTFNHYTTIQMMVQDIKPS